MEGEEPSFSCEKTVARGVRRRRRPAQQPGCHWPRACCIYGNLSELGRYNPVNENSRNRAFGLGAPYLHLMEGLRWPGQMDKLVEPAGTTAVP